MNNKELQRLLQQGRVPERPSDYWEAFPEKIVQALRRADHAVPRNERPAGRPRWTLAWGAAFASVFLGIGLLVGIRLGRDANLDAQSQAELAAYLREIEALFPGQLQAIVFEKSGPRLLLSERPDVPRSAPIFVRICRNQDCRSYLTFSGQRVGVAGEEFEVLLDANGGVILLGEKAIWSSAGTRSARLPFRIEATLLERSG